MSWLFRDALSREEIRAAVLEATGATEALHFPATYLSRSMRARNDSSEGQPLFTVDDEANLKKLLLERVEAAAKSGALRKHPRWRHILSHWMMLAPEAGEIANFKIDPKDFASRMTGLDPSTMPELKQRRVSQWLKGTKQAKGTKFEEIPTDDDYYLAFRLCFARKPLPRRCVVTMGPSCTCFGLPALFWLTSEEPTSSRFRSTEC